MPPFMRRPLVLDTGRNGRQRTEGVATGLGNGALPSLRRSSARADSIPPTAVRDLRLPLLWGGLVPGAVGRSEKAPERRAARGRSQVPELTVGPYRTDDATIPPLCPTSANAPIGTALPT